MAKMVDGEQYLTTGEVKQSEEFGWVRDTLYKAVKRGQLNAHRFFGDKKTYWKYSELQALKKPEKIDPKDLLVTAVVSDTSRENTALGVVAPLAVLS